MSSDDLTFVEKSVLLVLMAEVIEVVPNVRLTNKHHIKVEVKSREKLERLGLVKTETENRRIYWELTDLGWKRGLEELGAEVPSGAGSGGGALYATLAAIRRHLDRAGVSPQDFYQPDGADEAVVSSAEIEARIRRAYRELAHRTGDWVKLADLRDLLGGLPRDGVDAVLVAMNRTPSVNITPEVNQKTLTKRDRDAAVMIGNQDKHAISIGA